MKHETLTPRNLDVLRTIVRLQDETGWQPTVRELGSVLGIHAPASVHRHIDRLERLGLVERLGARRRVTDLGCSVVQVREVAA